MGRGVLLGEGEGLGDASLHRAVGDAHRGPELERYLTQGEVGCRGERLAGGFGLLPQECGSVGDHIDRFGEQPGLGRLRRSDLAACVEHAVDESIQNRPLAVGRSRCLRVHVPPSPRSFRRIGTP